MAVAGTHAESVAREAGWDDADVDRVVLAVIEAVANAVEHGPGRAIRVRVQFTRTPPAFRIEVEDGGEGPRTGSLESPALPDVESVGGRGLYILHALADRVQVERGTVALTFMRRDHSA